MVITVASLQTTLWILNFSHQNYLTYTNSYVALQACAGTLTMGLPKWPLSPPGLHRNPSISGKILLGVYKHLHEDQLCCWVRHDGAPPGFDIGGFSHFCAGTELRLVDTSQNASAPSGAEPKSHHAKFPSLLMQISLPPRMMFSSYEVFIPTILFR